MKATIKTQSKEFEIDFSKGKDISIPLIFNGDQPNTYGVNKAISVPYRDDHFIGDTREGGPCNFETHTFTPHCNGTHTECIGHITKERINILSSLQDLMIPATLITVQPRITSEDYIPVLNDNDLVISRSVLEQQLKNVSHEFLEGLIIRTLPNNSNKKSRDYTKESPSFFSIQAMEYIVELGITHLLVDTPSVDKLFDDGFLSAHNIFWKTKKQESNNQTNHKTITEMIFIDNSIVDGSYLLNLQIATFASDASPSRPILFEIHDI